MIAVFIFYKYRQSSFQNAYVLIYERLDLSPEVHNVSLSTTIAGHTNGVNCRPSTDSIIPENKPSEPEQPTQLLSEVDAAELKSMKEFRDSLREKNRNYFIKKILFNPDYSQFLVSILKTYTSYYSSPREEGIPEPDFFIFQFLATAFLTTVLRTSEKYYSYEFLKSFMFILGEVKKT